MNPRRAALVLTLTAPLLVVACTATPPQPSPEPTTADSGEDLDTCLVGDWTADASFVGDFMEQVILEQRQSGPPTAARAEGDITLAYSADGTFTYSPDITFEIDNAVGGTQTGDLTGTASGTWNTVDGILLSNVDETDVLLRLSTGGEPEPFNGVLGWENIPTAVSEMTCEGDQLKAVFNLINTSFPMELTRES